MESIRAQYHFREVGSDLLAWDVRELIKLGATIDPLPINVDDIQELDENYWFNHDVPTPRRFAEHARLINEADLSYPIIIDCEGRVMDGMHRICKALMLGQAQILAVQFSSNPEPHYVNVQPSELPYD